MASCLLPFLIDKLQHRASNYLFGPSQSQIASEKVAPALPDKFLDIRNRYGTLLTEDQARFKPP